MSALPMNVPGNPTVFISNIWGTSSSDIFIVGADGLLLHYDGSVWSRMNSNTEVQSLPAFGETLPPMFLRLVTKDVSSILTATSGSA